MAATNKEITDKVTEINDRITELNGLLDGKLDVTKIANNLVTTEAGYALDARMGKALSDEVDMKVQMIRYNAVPYIMAIDNIGSNVKKRITLENNEQVVYLIGAGTMESYYFYQLGGSMIATHNFGGCEINTVVDSHIIHIELPSYFRGILISYKEFSLTDE